MTTQLYIHRDGQQFGPYTTEDTQKHLRDGTLVPTDLAWYEGAADWMPLSAIPGISAAAAPPPPPPRTMPPLAPGLAPAPTGPTNDTSTLKRYKRNTNIGVGVGFLLALIGNPTRSEAGGVEIGSLMLLAGSAMFIWGCCNYAMKKGHHWAWGFLGFLSIFGLIALVLFKDRNKGKL